MAKGKKQIAKRKKTGTKKTSIKKASFSLSVIKFLMFVPVKFISKMGLLVGRFIIFLGLLIGRWGKNNLLASAGICSFLCILTFVGVNAFLQPVRPPESIKSSTNMVEPSSDLMATQRKLAEIDLYSGEIDGLGGPKTRAALENWQKLRLSLEKGKQTHQKDDPLVQIIRNAKE